MIIKADKHGNCSTNNVWVNSYKMYLPLFRLILILNFAFAENEFEKCVRNNGTKLQESICLPKNYHATETPEPRKQFTVWCNVSVLYLNDINLKTSTFGISVGYSNVWFDKRIKIDPDYDDSKVTVAADSKKYLWIPGISITHDLTSEVGQNIGGGQGSHTFKVGKDGSVETFGKVKLIIGCKMNFEKFPFDKQVCKLQTMSRELTEKELVFDAIIRSDKQTKFNSEYDTKIDPFPNPYFVRGIIISHQKFSGLGFNITFTRRYNTYMWMYFAPTAFVQAIVGISFIIPPITAVPGRMALLITTLLVQIEMLRDVEALLPGSDTLTALTVYILFSIICILFAFTEYAMILLTDRIRKRYKYSPVSFEKVDLTTIILYHLIIIIFHSAFIEMYMF